MIPLGPAFRKLRLERPREWLSAMDEAMVLSRSHDPAKLPSWGGIARVANVGTEWVEYVARQDELRSRYRHLPWRPAGAPHPAPRFPIPDFDPAEFVDLETTEFVYPTFAVTLRDVLQPEHLRPCWYYVSGYTRLWSLIPPPRRPIPARRPILGVWWFGGPFPVDGWRTLAAAGERHEGYIPGYCLTPEASSRVLRLPRHAGRPNGVFETVPTLTSRP